MNKQEKTRANLYGSILENLIANESTIREQTERRRKELSAFSEQKAQEKTHANLYGDLLKNLDSNRT